MQTRCCIYAFLRRRVSIFHENKYSAFYLPQPQEPQEKNILNANGYIYAVCCRFVRYNQKLRHVMREFFLSLVFSVALLALY